MARAAAEIDPVEPTNSRRLILPGPRRLSGPSSMRKLAYGYFPIPHPCHGLARPGSPCDDVCVRSFLTFLAAYMLSQFYRSFLAVIAPELARELALDPQALGNMQAFWIAGFVAMQIPVGFALDGIGPRRTVASLMLAAVAGAVLFARAQSALDLDIDRKSVV